MGEHPGDGLVEGARLLVRGALGGEDLRAVRGRDSGGGVGAVGSDPDDQVGTPGLSPQALGRVGEAVLFVVGRAQHHRAQRTAESVGWGLGATRRVPMGAVIPDRVP